MIVSSDSELISSIIEFLQREFEVKAFDVDSYLGLQIERQPDGSIFLHQSNYARRVLERFQMIDCNSVATPSDPNQVLYSLENDNYVSFPYREAVGSIMYLAVATRPDLSFAIVMVSRFLEKPTKIHVNAVKRILKYIKGTTNYGIFFKSKVNLTLCGFSDADYAGDIDSRRSTTGFLFKFGSGTLSWSSERQKSVALSTTESEYVASAQAVKELIWLQFLMGELLPENENKPILAMDNQSAIKLIKNPENHKRTKHIDIRFHFIREKYVKEKLFDLKFVSTTQQIADILTKPLARDKFEKFRELMGIIEMN